MPTDPLIPRIPNTDPAREAAVLATERAILHALAGAPPDADLADGITPPALADAIEIYRQAGRAALAEQAASPWWQIHLEFTDWNSAEQAAADHLAPLLHRVQTDSLTSAWWFIRKHPCWRLRLRPGADGQAMRPCLGAALDALAAAGRIRRWWPGIYETETAAFGGPAAMQAAHDLFDADSHAIIALLQGDHSGLGRRELSLLLCGILLQSADLEWYEQADVWDRVSQDRPLRADVPARKITGLSDSLITLMHADTTPEGPLFGSGGPVASAAGWADAFRQTGRTLASQSRTGTLRRGLREILSYHIIFHWNRLGISTRQQSILAVSARAAILGPPAPARRMTVRPGTATASPSTETLASLDQAMMRLPLVPQARLRCLDLETRVRHVRDHATSCHLPTEVEERIDRACSALNLAALIAADSAMPSYAAQLCEQQFQIFHAAWPLEGRTAIASLQPLINLARLDGRAGDPDTMFQTLDQINRAVNHGGSAEVHGTSICFDGFTITAADGAKVKTWLRNVLRQDGTRALVAAGHWAKAATHAAHYDQPDQHMREGRQTRIITHSINGNTDSALSLIDTSKTTEPWEQSVAACLRIHARARVAHPIHADLMTVLATAGRLPKSDQNITMFRIRLGLTAVDLALALNHELANLPRALIEEAAQSGDAYACQEVLSHAPCRTFTTPAQAEALLAIVERAALGQGSIAPHLIEELTASAQTAATVLMQALSEGRG
ncbi:thiopeptide-type bacteriocin biosynthesis protein [Sphaerisporangium sp. NPDC051017]|uniref:thiopeptide-type bacteriocin biosynthesis protein n=1 Tax=unclassified Sphaerisporangium TaxID=2630420 RepID=UPI0033F69B1F